MHRLDATYSAVLQKLHTLSALSSRLRDLGELAKSTVQEFEAADTNCRSDFAAQIHGIERFRDELDPIQVLKDRLMVQKRRVKDYHERLDRVQERIDRHREMEIIWRQRASRKIPSSSSPHPPARFLENDGSFRGRFRKATTVVGFHIRACDFMATRNRRERSNRDVATTTRRLHAGGPRDLGDCGYRPTVV